MFKPIKKWFRTNTTYDHWDAPEIWREVPQSRFEKPKVVGKRPQHRPRIYL